METKSLLHEPGYMNTQKDWENFSLTKGFTPVAPTPIISPFWNTTFTPSSSEIIFRHLLNGRSQKENAIFTCQPCIRVNDLQRLSGGWHLLLFHMLSSFEYDISNYQESLLSQLLRLAKAAGRNLSQLYFTVPTKPYLPSPYQTISIDGNLLKKFGVPANNILLTNGKANYQEGTNILNNSKVKIEGPKIEIFVKDGSDIFWEIGTFTVAVVNIEKSGAYKILAFGSGLERVSALSQQVFNIHSLDSRKKIIHKISRATLHKSLAGTSLALEIIAMALNILEAWAFIASKMQNNFTKYNKGIQNHYIRIVKEFCRLNQGLGISMKKFITIVSQECGMSLDFLLNDERFLKYANFNWEYI